VSQGKDRGINQKNCDSTDLQDYVVVPGQLWIDGITDSNGTIRQFVALPFSSDDSVEKQMTGIEATSDVQIEITPYGAPPLTSSVELKESEVDYPLHLHMVWGEHVLLSVHEHETMESIKEQIYDSEGIPPDYQRLIYGGRQLEDSLTVSDYQMPKGAKLHLVIKCFPRLTWGTSVYQMNLAADRKMAQVIHKDQLDRKWIAQETTVFNVRILNTAAYKAITGRNPPSKSPADPNMYHRYGYRFLNLYEEPAENTEDFSMVKSLARIPPKTEDEIEVKPTIIAVDDEPERYVAPKTQTADPSRNPPDHAYGIVNPNGPLREFRTVHDLEKEYGGNKVSNYSVMDCNAS
jgi:hypothetical protein